MIEPLPVRDISLTDAIAAITLAPGVYIVAHNPFRFLVESSDPEIAYHVLENGAGGELFCPCLGYKHRHDCSHVKRIADGLAERFAPQHP